MSKNMLSLSIGRLPVVQVVRLMLGRLEVVQRLLVIQRAEKIAPHEDDKYGTP